MPTLPELPRERAILVGFELKSRGTASSAVSHNSEESLDELAALALSANADVVERVTQSRPVPDAATLVGSGKVQELSAMVKALAADLVIADYELTPTQQRNLEKAFDTKVIDRTQLILDIFARRARTREGRLQVELAQLRYLLPRLTGHGAGMSRLGGGIGTRGPGETKLETDRRRIHQRIRKIAQELESVRAGRAVHRAQRQSVPLATVALVGYTNAGKSTLFNRLTTAGVLADARMFATLDPTVRALVLPSRRKVLVSDTVGFIRNLPTTLVKAFRATLEEVTEATLLLHIIDISSPFASAQAALVRGVLAEIGAESIPQLLVLNKIDLLPESAAAAETARRLSGEAGIAEETPAVPIAARTGQGMDRLLAVIDRILPFDPVVHVRFRFPPAQAGKVSLLHDRGKVLDIHYSDAGCEVEAEVPESLRGKLESFLIRR